MSKIKLIELDEKYADEVMNFKNEVQESGEILQGCGELRDSDTFEEWKQASINSMSEETVRKGFVPASQFIAINTSDDKFIGAVNIRHRLNDGLLKSGGHIGYIVIPSERRKGYCTEMLNLALKECSKLGIDNVLITAKEDNIGSNKVIKKNGFVFENTVEHEGSVFNRYWKQI